ncbi:MAG: hypothetical protein V1744_07330 [Candidatus Altiarchaeota archaeon]
MDKLAIKTIVIVFLAAFVFFILLFTLIGGALLFSIFGAAGGNDKVTIQGHVGVPSGTKSSDGAKVTGMAVASTWSTRSRPSCEPFVCRGVSNAPVAVVRPGKNGWEKVPGASTTTDKNGDFTVSIDRVVLDSDYPVVVAAVAPDGSPLMSVIPSDLAAGKATIELAIDRTTTVAAAWHCPGGLNHPSGKGGFCWRDPKEESKSLERMYAAIDLYFEYNPSTTTDLEDYLLAISKDPMFIEAINEVLQKNGLPKVSATDPNGYKPVTAENARNLESIGTIITQPATIQQKTTSTLKATTTISPCGIPAGEYLYKSQDCDSWRKDCDISNIKVKLDCKVLAEEKKDWKTIMDEYSTPEEGWKKTYTISDIPFDGKTLKRITTRNMCLELNNGDYQCGTSTSTETWTLIQ